MPIRPTCTSLAWHLSTQQKHTLWGALMRCGWFTWSTLSICIYGSYSAYISPPLQHKSTKYVRTRTTESMGISLAGFCTEDLRLSDLGLEDNISCCSLGEQKLHLPDHTHTHTHTHLHHHTTPQYTAINTRSLCNMSAIDSNNNAHTSYFSLMVFFCAVFAPILSKSDLPCAVLSS